MQEVSTVQLAGWIKDRKEGLRVIDLRESKDYTAYHIPSAQQFSADVIAPSAAPTTLVLYSDTGSANDRKFAAALLPEGSKQRSVRAARRSKRLAARDHAAAFARQVLPPISARATTRAAN